MICTGLARTRDGHKRPKGEATYLRKQAIEGACFRIIIRDQTRHPLLHAATAESFVHVLVKMNLHLAELHLSATLPYTRGGLVARRSDFTQ